MDPRYKARFTPEMLHEAACRYGVEGAALRELDGFESFIYEFSRAGQDFILRIGHSSRRPERLVQGEAEWLHYLRSSGCDGVAGPVNSRDGNLVEALDDGHGEQFVATAFEKAPGRHMGKADAAPELFEAWGALLGRMHALSERFHPQWPRPHWDDPMMLDVQEWLPAGEEKVRARYQELRDHLDTLPRSDSRVYGMIHQDAHAGNFFIVPCQGSGPQHSGPQNSGPQISGPQITLFDFDDCCFSWYANDIAIVLFYAVMGQTDTAAFTHHFLSHFLRGYRREKEISVEWLAEIPYFLKLREIDLYAVIHRSFDVNNLTDPWVKRYMEGRKERLEAGQPYLDFDFTTV